MNSLIIDYQTKVDGNPVDLPASLSVWLATKKADFLRGRTMWANRDVEELLARSDSILKNDDLKMVLKGWP